MFPQPQVTAAQVGFSTTSKGRISLQLQIQPPSCSVVTQSMSALAPGLRDKVHLRLYRNWKAGKLEQLIAASTEGVDADQW